MDKIVSRKRSHPDDSPIGLQNKVFINQKLIELNDNEKMKKIYDKTFKLLFNGSKNLNNNANDLQQPNGIFSNVRLYGDGTLKFPLEQKIAIKLPDIKLKSKCCNKEAFVISDCSNCNLKLCEYCASSCAGGCGKFLCEFCISLFDCGSIDEPMCKNCSFLN